MKKAHFLTTLAALTTGSVLFAGIGVNRATKHEQDLFTKHETHQFDRPDRTRYSSGAVVPLEGSDDCISCQGGVTPYGTLIPLAQCPLFVKAESDASSVHEQLPESVRLFRKILLNQVQSLKDQVKSLEDKVEQLEE